MILVTCAREVLRQPSARTRRPPPLLSHHQEFPFARLRSLQPFRGRAHPPSRSTNDPARPHFRGGGAIAALTFLSGGPSPRSCISRIRQTAYADKGTRNAGALFFISSPAFRLGEQMRQSWCPHRQHRQRRCPWPSWAMSSRPCYWYSSTTFRQHSFGSYHERCCYSCPSTGWKPCYSIQSLFRFLVRLLSRRPP